MDDFPSVGLSLSALNSFIEECGGRKSFVHANGNLMTTLDVVKKHIKPLTKRNKCSYCMQLQRNGVIGVGTATIFISHAWLYNFLDLFDALMKYFAESPNTMLWLDVFTINQHIQTNHDFSWWSTTFKDAIRNFGCVVMVISPWENPLPFTRAWCLFEIYSATITNSTFDVAMTIPQEKKFTAAIMEDVGSYFDMLAMIDLRQSEASFENDKLQIFDVIERSCGFQKLNILVCEYIREWILRIVDFEVDSAGTVKERHNALLTKSKILIKQDKPLDAKHILLKELMDEYKNAYGLVSPEVADIHFNLSHVYDGLRNYKMSISEALQAITILANCGESHSIELAECHCHISFQYILYGCFSAINREDRIAANANSLKHATKALDMKIQLFGQNHRCLSPTLNNHGNALYRAGKTLDAIASFDKQLDILTKHNLLEHPEAASCFYMKGMMYSGMSYDNNHQDKDLGTNAAQYYERCIALRIRKLGFEHHSVAAAYRNLADVYCDCCDNLEEAIMACKKSLDSILESSLGRESPHLPEAATHLFTMIRKLGEKKLKSKDYHTALKCFSEACEVSQEFKLDKTSAVTNIEAQVATVVDKLKKQRIFIVSMCVLSLSSFVYLAK